MNKAHLSVTTSLNHEYKLINQQSILTHFVRYTHYFPLNTRATFLFQRISISRMCNHYLMQMCNYDQIEMYICYLIQMCNQDLIQMCNHYQYGVQICHH